MSHLAKHFFWVEKSARHYLNHLPILLLVRDGQQRHISSLYVVSKNGTIKAPETADTLRVIAPFPSASIIVLSFL